MQDKNTLLDSASLLLNNNRNRSKQTGKWLHGGHLPPSPPHPKLPSTSIQSFQYQTRAHTHNTVRSLLLQVLSIPSLLSISGGRHLLRHPVCQHCQSLFATALSSSSFFNCNSFLYILMIYSASCTCIFFFAVTTSTVGFLE